MAQSRNSSGKKRSSSGGRKNSSSSSARKTSGRASPRSSRSPSRSTVSDSPSFADWFHAFTKTRAFIPVASVAVITALVLIDLLLSWNNYDRFFKILGFELLIVGIIWVIGLVLSFGETAPSSED